jgi:hypothetical protein
MFLHVLDMMLNGVEDFKERNDKKTDDLESLGGCSLGVESTLEIIGK